MNTQTRDIIKLLASFKPKRGEISYRLEGVFRTIAIFAPDIKDRQKLSRAITTVCKRFNLGQLNKQEKRYEITNRYAIAALDALAKADA